MSIWTNKIKGFTAGVLFTATLSACQMTAAPGPEKLSRFSGPPPSRMQVAGGQLIVSGPEGFCIDRDSSRSEPSGAALVVLSPCRGLGAGLFAPSARQAAVLTAGVGARPIGADAAALLPALRRWAATPAGRAGLSRSGEAGRLRVERLFEHDGAIWLRLHDPGDFAWGAVQPDYWRAVVPAGGRLVTLSVLALPDAPLSEREGFELLAKFIATLRQGSALPS